MLLSVDIWNYRLLSYVKQQLSYFFSDTQYLINVLYTTNCNSTI